MKRLLSIIVLAVCWQAKAQGRFSATLSAQNPTPADALMGTASLNLKGSILSYELAFTGRWLGNYSLEMDPRNPPQPVITIEGIGNSTSLPWFSGVLGSPNHDLIFRQADDPPLPQDYYWAHHRFEGSVELSETIVAGLLRGEGILAVNYGPWGNVSGLVAVVPEPSTFALWGVGLTSLLLCRCASSRSV
jgi:hypothetical protein